MNEEKKTFSKKVVDHISDLILSGQVKAGDKLPPERELAERMEVSRPTIREAFKILSAMGLIIIKHGNGVFVTEESERRDNMASFIFVQTDTIRDLFEVRKMLETESAAWASKRGTTEFLVQIYLRCNEVFKIVSENPFSSAEEKEKFLSDSDQQFHLMVSEAGGNEVSLRLMNSLIDILYEHRMKSLKIPGRALQSLREHIMIAEALLTRNPDMARSKMYEHISSVENDLILEVEEVEQDNTTER